MQSTDQIYATLRDDVVLVNVHFNAPALYSHNDGQGTHLYVRSSHTHEGRYKRYSYKATAAAGVTAGDVVVVTVGEGELKVATVAEVLPIHHADRQHDLKWIVSRVDLSAVQRVLQQEELFRSRMSEAQAARARREALAALVDEGHLQGLQLQDLDGMSHLHALLPAESGEKSES